MKKLAGLLFILKLTGCVTDQHAVFEGSLTRGSGESFSHAVYPTGSYFDARSKSLPNVVAGLGLGIKGAFLVLVHDREAYENHAYRISNDSMKSVYLAEQVDMRDDAFKNAFMKGDQTSIEQMDGVHRLKGMFNIEKWHSNNDFRIVMAMQSEENIPIAIEGVITRYETQHFRPHVPLIVGMGACIGTVFPKGVFPQAMGSPEPHMRNKDNPEKERNP